MRQIAEAGAIPAESECAAENSWDNLLISMGKNFPGHFLSRRP
jgi:hypothetical protein